MAALVLLVFINLMSRFQIVIFYFISGLLFSCTVPEPTPNLQPALILTNYTYDFPGDSIGRVITKNKSIRLVGESSKYFKIDPNSNLLSSNSILPDSLKWYDVIIERRYGEKKYLDTFRIVKNQFIENKVIAHRGAWKRTGAIENTVTALNHAIALGCEGSEFDVHMSADRALFVYHDPIIYNHTIELTSSKQLAQLKLSNGEVLPTLKDYLQAGMKQNNTRLILEIKPAPVNKNRSKEIARQVVHEVYKYKAQAWITYISFDYEILKEVLRIDPFAKVSYLRGSNLDKTLDELSRDRIYCINYHFSIYQKDESLIDLAISKNIKVNSWTVDSPAIMDWLLEKNIDFITTDEPEMLLKKVRRLNLERR